MKKISRSTKTIIAGAVILGSILQGLTACDLDDEDSGLGDAGVGPQDTSKADIINFPDLFANIAMKCDGHGHRVYVSTRNAPPVVVTDSSCPGGTPR